MLELKKLMKFIKLNKKDWVNRIKKCLKNILKIILIFYNYVIIIWYHQIVF